MTNPDYDQAACRRAAELLLAHREQRPGLAGVPVEVSAQVGAQAKPKGARMRRRKCPCDPAGYWPGARCLDGLDHRPPEPVTTLTGQTVGHLCPECGTRMTTQLVSNWGGNAKYRWIPVNDDGSPMPLLRCPSNGCRR